MVCPHGVSGPGVSLACACVRACVGACLCVYLCVYICAYARAFTHSLLREYAQAGCSESAPALSDCAVPQDI